VIFGYISEMMCEGVYRVGQKVNPRKGDHQVNVVTLSNFNQFSKFFSPLERERNLQLACLIFPTTPQPCCHTILENLKVKFLTNCKRQSSKRIGF